MSKSTSIPAVGFTGVGLGTPYVSKSTFVPGQASMTLPYVPAVLRPDCAAELEALLKRVGLDRRPHVSVYSFVDAPAAEPV